MSYIDFDYENNSILICKGDAKKRNEIKKEKTSKHFSEYSFEGQFNGVEITDFLSDTEKDGLIGELRFKELLEENNIPFLYIGQGPYGIERSGILIDKMKSKRADFLVNIQDMGTILFDAKCRNKIGFHNSKEKYFPLFISELEALKNLQDSILMPVWLAFTERQLINKKENTIFYFISISTITKFHSGIKDHIINKKEFDEISVLRIPDVLLTKIENQIVFEVGYKNVEEELLRNYAAKNTGLNRILKDKIKEIIRTRQCFKSNVHKELIKDKIFYSFPAEISFKVESLISENIIEYKPKSYLKLIGE
ncbi:hypothetical protein B0A67_03335 [Flavobacterium aquidurense]|uniref:hypothetical protein n=1 Tax=Flavobacterium aquidurense TaxID=362413 RepID=UPI0009228178|nr:hypothetical protein [Flavobacterium aquidurense]OXA73722.1 hypothetical protein B0A67_03335 [Flavobacterium aquidurense]SHG78687.1 hypothetical protein SAMN05444481_107161 [Flavobacterium frigidimaris]